MKKRLRTVKRGILKRELAAAGSKLHMREAQKEEKLHEALSGFIKPPVDQKNAFRSDDPDAVIPQHKFRQGPDFRSAYAGPGIDAGHAVWGSNRPKHPHGQDAPTAAVTKPGSADGECHARDAGVSNLLRTTEQLVPKYASKQTKRRIKNQARAHVHSAPRRWT